MEHTTESLTRLVFQLAIILVAAKVGGEVFERYLKAPAVLGELAAGVIIGPFALGGIDFPGIGPLFQEAGNPVAAGASAVPVSDSLWAIAQVGAIVLLFSAGLETDLRQFVRYAGPASLVASGGVLLPFVFGVVITVAFGLADSFTAPEALFMGSIMTATSVGISVRVLGDLGRLNSPEGITILSAAVLDDVLGILVLTIVVGIVDTGSVSPSAAGLVALKAIGFWAGLTGIGILLSKHISNLLNKFRVAGAGLALALALAFLAAGLAESFGLAMIIGAFSLGLALSGTELAHRLDQSLRGVHFALVPVFFVVMGTMVDVTAMEGVWAFGLALTVLAIVGKVFGCGLPALFTGFNRWGALRIGIGMLPRGEVALIIAGIGIAEGIIQPGLFGVAIMMTVVTTVIAPFVLSRVFRAQTPGTHARPSDALAS